MNAFVGEDVLARSLAVLGYVEHFYGRVGEGLVSAAALMMSVW